MKSSLHPIAAILNLCNSEKGTIASKQAMSQIKGAFFFEVDEINMLSIQLTKGLQVSKIIPEERFSVPFDEIYLKEIFEKKLANDHILLILLSCVSWLITTEKTQKVENFALVLDLLDSVSENLQIIYQVTNYFYVCVIQLNVEFPFNKIDKQTNNFCEKYKNKPDFAKDAILLWIQTAYSFDTQTTFAQSLLIFAGNFYKLNQGLFSDEILENLCDLLNPKFLVLDPTALYFLIHVANILPQNIIFEITGFLIESILPVIEMKEITYLMFDGKKYDDPIVYEHPKITSYSLNFPTEKSQYINNFIFPQVPYDPDFRISQNITSVTNYIIKILLGSSVSPDHFSASFVSLLKNSIQSKHFFDIVASILSILIFVEQIDSHEIFQILIDSSLFDPVLTIFTNDSDLEPLHKLRMLSYKFIVFTRKDNCEVFFQKKHEYPLIIAEFFYYALRMQIPFHVLKSSRIAYDIYSLLLTYQNSKYCDKPKSKDFPSKTDEPSQTVNIQQSSNQDITPEGKENDTSNQDSLDDNILNESNLQDDNIWGNSIFIDITPKQPLFIPNEFANESDKSDENDQINASPQVFKQSPTRRQLKLVYSQSISTLQDFSDYEDEGSMSRLCETTPSSFLSKTDEETTSQIYEHKVELTSKSLQPNEILESSFQDYANEPEPSNSDAEEQQECTVDNEIIEFKSSYEITKIHHKIGLNAEENYFLQWFDKIMKSEYSSKEKNNFEGSFHCAQCALVFILAFITKAIKDDKKLASHWNWTTGFIPALFSLIFDEYLRPAILSILKMEWEADSTSTTEISQGCLVTIFQQTYDEDFELLDLQLLTMINEYLRDIVSSNKKVSKANKKINYREFLNPLCHIITNILANFDISSEFLHQSMIFFGYFQPEIKHATRTAILAAIKRTQGNNPDSQFYHDLILLITSIENKKFSANYLISHPKMASVFIKAFIESSLFYESISFIDSLCQASYANARACHKGKVDIVLLNLLGNIGSPKFHSNQKEDNKNFDILPVLSLLSKITLAASSMPVVNMFIGLFNPIDNKYLPPYIQELVQTLTNIIQARKNQPIATFPLFRNSPIIKILKFSGSIINQGITCIFYLYIDQFSQRFSPTILKISDKKQTLSIQIQDLHISINSNLQPSTTFPNLIPINGWIYIAFSILPSKKIAECYIQNQRPISMTYDFVDFHFGTVSCEIIGGDESAPTIESSILIGNFALYPYIDSNNLTLPMNVNKTKSNDIDKFSTNSQIPDSSPNNNLNKNANMTNNSNEVLPHISLSFECEQSLLCIKKEFNSELDAILTENNIIETLSLPDVLIRFFKAEILIPLLAQSDLYLYDQYNLGDESQLKKMPSSYIGSILNLLSSTLKLSIEAQQSFEMSDGFRIISYILKKLNSKNLTFDLYLHFIFLFEAISWEKLKKQIFCEILTNSEIWSLSDATTLQQILTHWNDDLLPSNESLFLKEKPFHRLIHSVSYFYFRNIGNGKRSHSNNKNNFNSEGKSIIDKIQECDIQSQKHPDIVSSIRNTIFQLLFSVAEKQFSTIDANTLFMTCIASSNFIFSEDLLNLVKVLARAKSSPFKNAECKEIIYFSLHLLFICEHEKIILSVISALMAIHSSNLIQSINILNHVEIIMLKIPKMFFTSSFVSSIIKMSYSYPDVLPIPCYIIAISYESSTNDSHGMIDCFLNDLHPNNEYATHALWFFWPIIVAIKCNKITEFMMNFIILSSKKDWKKIFMVINIAARSLNENPLTFQRIFLKQLGNCFLNYQNLQNIDQFFEISKYFITTKSKEYPSKALSSLFAQSPFIEGNEMEIVSYESFGEIQPLYNNLSSNSDPSSSNLNKNPALNSNVFIDDLKFFEASDFFSNKIIMISQIPMKTKFALDLNEEGEWLDNELISIIANVYEKVSTTRTTIFNNTNTKLFSDFVHALNVGGSPDCNKLHTIYEENEESSYNKTISMRISEIASCIVVNRVNSIAFMNHIKPKHENFYIESLSYINEEDHKDTSNNKKSCKLWEQLWQQLTVDRAPWRNSLPYSSLHFKRSNRILAYFCPFKLKTNMEFNDHKDASFNRDFGSSTTAKEHFQQYQKELEELYKKNIPPLLLIQTEDLENDLSQNEEIYTKKEKSQQYEAVLINVTHHEKITFCVMRNKFQIIYPEDSKSSNNIKTIEAKNVTHIFMRSFLHHERSFEIITKNGKSYLIDLVQVKSIQLLKMISKLSAFGNAVIQTVPFKKFVETYDIQKRWCMGLLSNFEYLMQLNTFGGRTFNETSLYPVFPWIIKDYSSTTIDLADPNVYRDLSIPIGATSETRLNELYVHMKDYMAIRNIGFLYNSCYISPLCVFLWLIRMEPFTTLHIQLQSGKFDHAARIFSSIPSAYRMVTNHMNDYRELIPEFFFDSSFLENRNRFDLGKIDGKQDVDDVVLPRWCKSAIEFIYIHRKALESDYVSKHLNEWIDLIFGYKQRGPAATQYNNTFDPCLYENVWTPENENNPSQRAMIEALLQHCGHIPNQLFTTPHPQKSPISIKPFTQRSCTIQTGINDNVYTKIYENQQNLEILYIKNNGVVTLARIFRSKDNISTTCTLFSDYSNVDLSLTTPNKLMNGFAFDQQLFKVFIATDSGNIRITDLRFKKEGTLHYHQGHINCIASSENFLVSGGSDTTINVFNNSSQSTNSNSSTPLVNGVSHLKTIPSFRSEITCCDINEKFGTIACGTKDGSILLIDTATLVTTMAIDIAPEVPIMIKVTLGWGFIVVYSTREHEGRIVPSLSVYDINGQFIRKKKISSPISLWTTYVSIDGFDYIACANDAGGISLFEVFFLNIEDSGVPRNSARVIGLKYSVYNDILIAVRENGTVFLYLSKDMNTKRFKNTVYRLNI